MGRLRDLTGKRFGRLFVIARLHKKWKCACDCGNFIETPSRNIGGGRKLSCGCLTKERAATLNKTHGMSKSPIYIMWISMVARARVLKGKNFKNYASRGVFVEDRWLKFENFYEDFGKFRPDGYSIERIDNDGPYSRTNCRWATRLEQAQNKRNTKRLTFNGVTRSLTEWCDEFRVPRGRTKQRLTSGKSFEQAFNIN